MRVARTTTTTTTTTTINIVLLKPLVMITLAVFSLLVISSVTATPHIITSFPNNTNILIFSLPFFVMPFLYGDISYYYVIHLWSHASNKTTYHHHVCTRGKPCPFICKWGGLRHLQPFRFLKAMDACKRKQESSSPPSMLAPKNKHQVVAVWILHVCTRGKLRGSFCLQMGGAAPPPALRFLKAMDACKKTKQGSGRRQHRCLQKASIRSSPCASFMFALGESYAGRFVCKWGGLRTPQPPAFKRQSMLEIASFSLFSLFFRDLSSVFIIPCFCIILEPS